MLHMFEDYVFLCGGFSAIRGILIWCFDFCVFVFGFLGNLEKLKGFWQIGRCSLLPSAHHLRLRLFACQFSVFFVPLVFPVLLKFGALNKIKIDNTGKVGSIFERVGMWNLG